MKQAKISPGYHIAVEKEGAEHWRLKLSGSVSSANSSRFLTDLTNYLSGGPVGDVTLDLGEISYFDSTAAAVIAQTRLRLEKKGAHLKLKKKKPEISGVFLIL